MADSSSAARIAGSQVVGGSALINSVVILTPRRALTSFAIAAERSQNAIAARAIDVAHVGGDQHARRNAVHRAGKHFADAHCAYGVDGAGGLGRRFQRQNQFRCCGKRIFAPRHQLAAGVSAFAFNHDALAGRRGDVRHQANVEFLPPQGTVPVQYAAQQIDESGRLARRPIRAAR